MGSLSPFLATLQILRVHNMVAAAAGVFAGYQVSGGRDYRMLVLPLVCTGLVTGLGNLINDYFDAESDRINKPARPIPAGKLTKGQVLGMYFVGTIATSALAVKTLPTNVMAVVLGWECLLAVYAMVGKRLPIVGVVLVSVIVSSAFAVGAMLAADYRFVVFPIVFAFLLVTGRELVKGAEDVEGDRSVGAATVAVRLGVNRAVTCGSWALFLCVIAAPLPFFLDVFNRAYMIIIESLFVPGVLFATFIMLRSPEHFTFRRASWILKFEMFCGIAAVTLGR